MQTVWAAPVLGPPPAQTIQENQGAQCIGREAKNTFRIAGNIYLFVLFCQFVRYYYLFICPLLSIRTVLLGKICAGNYQRWPRCPHIPLRTTGGSPAPQTLPVVFLSKYDWDKISDEAKQLLLRMLTKVGHPSPLISLFETSFR